MVLYGVIFMKLPLPAQDLRTALTAITEANPSTNWLHFKEELQLSPQELFAVHKKSLGLGDNDEMREFREYASPSSGILQQRFQQYYNGVKVHGAVMNVYSRQGTVIKSNGRVIVNLAGSSTPQINEQAAFDAALQAVPSEQYRWQNPDAEQRLKNKKKDVSATYFPKGELLYMYRKGSAKKSMQDYELCWKFAVNVTRGDSKYVFVSALTGEIINTLPINLNCNGTTVQTPMNGAQQIYTSVQGRCDYNASYYELWDDCSVDIKVENDDFGAGTDDPICNWNSTNTWGTGNSALQYTTGDGVQVLWGMRKTYLWHLNNYNWNSYDNSGGSIDCTVMYEFENANGNPTGNNAQYNEFEEDFDFGYGSDGLDGADSYTTLDIVAHEFTHGVDDYSADLDYSDESGALDESFADIFGEIVETFTDLGFDTTTWVHGEDKGSVGRSFSNPNDQDNPDTYQGTFWCNYNNSPSRCTDNDHGGVHTNSGVQNHFFYLLVEGGDDYTDFGTPYSVNGIGWEDASAIAFLAHMYLWGTAEYIDSRDAWLEAASDIFGSCSNQAIQVGNAWHAVGVGAQSPDYNKLVLGTVAAATGNHTKQAINKVFTFNTVDIVSVSGMGEVRFYAGNEVVLAPGFTAPSGCAFVGRINPCSITLHTAPRIVAQSDQLKPGVASVEKINKGFEVFPNPYTNSFTLQFVADDNEIPEIIRIMNSAGVMVLEQPLANSSREISAYVNTDGLAAGIYFVQVVTNQRSLVTKTSKMDK